MHLHAGHVHVQIELHVADIDELTVMIAKFDQHFVAALAERSFARNEIYREVVNVLGEEWRAGDFCRSESLPRAFSAVENRDHGDDQCDPLENTLSILPRRNDLGR